MGSVKIFVADDHPIVRNGIKATFSGDEGYEIVGEAENGLTALQGVSTVKPDLVILDISMPELDGIIVTERIKKDFPGIMVIVLSMHQSRQYAIDAFRAGASGFILKGGEADEILLAARNVMAGQVYVSPPLVNEIMSDFLGIIKGEQSIDPINSLTLREKEVLQLIAEGHTTKNVAAKLFLSASTIKSYRVKIMKKLKVSDTAGLIKAALKTGLIKLE